MFKIDPVNKFMNIAKRFISKSLDLEIEGYSLERHFLNELNLSNVLLKRYSHLLAEHPKEPEMKELQN